MGHSRIGTLPRTRQWRKVIQRIADGADVIEIAKASSTAAEESLSECGHAAIPRQAFYILARIPLAARTENFPAALRSLGIYIDGPITLAALCSEDTMIFPQCFEDSAELMDLGVCTVAPVRAVVVWWRSLRPFRLIRPDALQGGSFSHLKPWSG